MYGLWKMFYEEMTEKELNDEYEIKNIPLFEKGTLRKERRNSIYSMSNRMSDRSSTNEGQKELHSSFIDSSEQTKKHDKETLKMPPRKLTDRYCFDEMYLDLGRRSSMMCNDISIASQGKMYIPVVIAIKTFNPYTDTSAELLDALTSVLASKRKKYKSNLHDIIYSYTEFCSYVLSLTHIRNPPPFSELIIPIANKEIKYYEGLICNLPCEGDSSVGHLFRLLPIKIGRAHV